MINWDEIRATHPFSPRSHTYSLIIRLSNRGYEVSDWAGFLCHTNNGDAVRELLRMEAKGQGYARSFITGKDQQVLVKPEGEALPDKIDLEEL